MFNGFYNGKRVVVTGHTGFKGAWLCHWLIRLGAKVEGFALEPEPEAILFDQLGLAERMGHTIGDVREVKGVYEFIERTSPEVVFHLAAQSLVRRSFDEPLETFATNVLGTTNLLEALRLQGRECSVVIVTTDKCYENREWLHAYRETDALGGYDPYSSSKACAELVTGAYRQSFFPNGTPVRLASARAGNVIGGGDWAQDRIVPDAVRALQNGRAIQVRNPNSTRPWQHVLEPLSGYLQLAASMSERGTAARQSLLGSFNFGPSVESNCTVANLVAEILKHWPGDLEDLSDAEAPHEAGRLNLAIDKAYHLLRWTPVWTFEDCVKETIHWYRDVDQGAIPIETTDRQIADYEAAALAQDSSWAHSGSIVATAGAPHRTNS